MPGWRKDRLWHVVGKCDRIGGMLELGYFRKRELRAHLDEDALGRASCNRVFLSVAIYLAYLFFVSHERNGVDFMLKRGLPFVLSCLAVWGIYYGIKGLLRDGSRGRAIWGVVMNGVCLYFHGMMLVVQVMEFWNAFAHTHGKIMFEYR
jgi:hypothetical protein